MNVSGVSPVTWFLIIYVIFGVFYTAHRTMSKIRDVVGGDESEEGLPPPQEMVQFFSDPPRYINNYLSVSGEI